MNDRELMKLAAKAAGISKKWDGSLVDELNPGKVWNPLADDGDAFRLMVTLRLWRDDANITCIERVEDHGGDEFSATRKAIVRAAAELARRM